MNDLRRVIFLLEDDPGRLRCMLDVLKSVLPEHKVHTENDAQTAIAWLDENQGFVELISLDHDLDSVPRADESKIDHGCGRDVSTFLLNRTPTCPVIVHTSNDVAGSNMFVELHRAEWPVFRVYPYDEHTWVSIRWKRMIEELISRGYLRHKTP